jgi:cholesterol transport system auxiliary component
MHTTRRLIVATLAAALATMLATTLTACAGKGPPPTLYDFGPLPPLQSSAATAAPAPALSALVISDAIGPAWLDSERMQYRLLYADAQQARPYAQNRWNAPPLQLLTQRLRSRLAQAGIKVLSPTDSAAGVPLLRLEADEFSQNFTGTDASAGQITLRVSLLRGHRLADQRTFQRSTPSDSADAAGGARALAASTDALAGDVLTWLASLPPPKE